MTYYTSNVVGAVPKFRIIGGTMSISNSTLIHVCTCTYILSISFFYLLIGVGAKVRWERILFLI